MSKEKNEEIDLIENKSILTSVKKLLGILEDNTEFDADIIMHINAGIGSLYQLGVGKLGFVVTSKNDTYEDLLDDQEPMFQDVKLYLYYKTRLGFDPPTTTSVIQAIKDMLDEVEWRMSVKVRELLREDGYY